MRHTNISMIDSFSESIDGVWAKVLNDESDEEDSHGFFKQKDPAPPSELDLHIDSALSQVDDENDLGCIFDGMFFAFAPDPEEESKPPLKVKKIRDIGLPPRPGRKKNLSKEKPKYQKEKEAMTHNFDKGFLSFMVASSIAENEKREEKQPVCDDVASVKSVENTASIPLVRRISLKKVGSSFRRGEKDLLEEDAEDDLFREKESSNKEDTGSMSPQEESRNEKTKKVGKDGGFFSYMLRTQEETRGAHENKPSTNEEKRQDDDLFGFFSFWFNAEEASSTTTHSNIESPSLARKFARATNRSSSSSDRSESHSQVHLVRRTSFRRERSGRKSQSLRSLQVERF